MNLDSSFSSSSSEEDAGSRYRKQIASLEKQCEQDWSRNGEGKEIQGFKYEDVNYPYTFKELADELHQGPHSFLEQGYEQEEAATILEEELMKMSDLGYDFYFKNDCQHNEKSQFCRRFLRRCWLRFNCRNPNCPKVKAKKGGWTTFYGLIFFTFKFVDITDRVYSDSEDSSQDDIRYPYVLRYNIRLYRQECKEKECGKMAKPEIFQSQMQAASRLFCYRMAEILTFEKDPVVKPKWHQHADDYQKEQSPDPQHQSKHCEACRQGVCKFFQHRKYEKSL